MGLASLLRFIVFALRPFSKSPAVYDWWDIGRFIGSLSGLSALGYLGRWADSVIATSEADSMSVEWPLTVIAPLVGFTLLLIVGGTRIFRENEKLKRSKLTLVFDPHRFPRCHAVNYYHGEKDEPLNCSVTYNVGVIAEGNQTIEGVQVYLTRCDVPDFDFSPVPLKRSDEPFGEDTSFIVHPGTIPTQFVSVVSWRSKTLFGFNGGGRFTGHPPTNLGNGQYRFTLLAQGKDTNSCEREFLLEMVDVMSFDPSAFRLKPMD